MELVDHFAVMFLDEIRKARSKAPHMTYTDFCTAIVTDTIEAYKMAGVAMQARAAMEKKRTDDLIASSPGPHLPDGV